MGRRPIILTAGVGAVLFLGCDPLRWLPVPAGAILYAVALIAGYILLLTAGIWAGRLLRRSHADDPFNVENESFWQETEPIENEYSVNLPTRFYYRGRYHAG